MNYIREINAFYDQIELNPLTASATLLWHTLMHINNKARWAGKFTVSVSVLRLKSGLTESSFKRARQELHDKGYITYESGQRNNAASYEMISQIYTTDHELETLEEALPNNHALPIKQMAQATETANNSRNTENKKDRNIAWLDHIIAAGNMNTMDHSMNENMDGNDSMDQRNGVSMNHSMDPGMNRGTNPLIKQKEKKNKINTKQKNNNHDDCRTMEFFCKNIDGKSPYVTSEIKKWIAKIGEPLVLDAMKRTLRLNKSNWANVQGILRVWIENGIRSVDEAILEDMEHKEKHKHQMAYAGMHVREEIVPDWFKEMKRKQKLEAMGQQELD